MKRIAAFFRNRLPQQELPVVEPIDTVLQPPADILTPRLDHLAQDLKTIVTPETLGLFDEASKQSVAANVMEAVKERLGRAVPEHVLDDLQYHLEQYMEQVQDVPRLREEHLHKLTEIRDTLSDVAQNLPENMERNRQNLEGAVKAVNKLKCQSLDMYPDASYRAFGEFSEQLIQGITEAKDADAANALDAIKIGMIGEVQQVFSEAYTDAFTPDIVEKIIRDHVAPATTEKGHLIITPPEIASDFWQTPQGLNAITHPQPAGAPWLETVTSPPTLPSPVDVAETVTQHVTDPVANHTTRNLIIASAAIAAVGATIYAVLCHNNSKAKEEKAAQADDKPPRTTVDNINYHNRLESHPSLQMV